MHRKYVLHTYNDIKSQLHLSSIPNMLLIFFSQFAVAGGIVVFIYFCERSRSNLQSFAYFTLSSTIYRREMLPEAASRGQHF